MGRCTKPESAKNGADPQLAALDEEIRQLQRKAAVPAVEASDVDRARAFYRARLELLEAERCEP